MDWETRALWLGAWLILAAFVGGGGVYAANSRAVDPDPIVVTVAEAARTVAEPTLVLAEPNERSIDSYRGYGTWVDVFDFDPAYSPPSVTAADIAEMASLGVRTIYLQAARLDDRTPEGLVDPWLLSEFVLTAHAFDIDVVGWYLPRFGEGTEDLDRTLAMSDFSVLGQRFDGVSLDIEWTGDGIDPITRTARLMELSAEAHARIGEDPFGAITFTPVQLEVLNETLWPGFPWAAMTEYYDVWLPMAYWSFRSNSSGYGEGYNYLEESARRLRANVGDPDALIHGIGGIGGIDGVDDPVDPPEPLATIEEVERFVDAIADTGSIGGSIYDWNTLEPAVRQRLNGLFAS